MTDGLHNPAEPLELRAARLLGFGRHRCHFAERQPGAPLACRCGAELTRQPRQNSETT